MLNKKNNRKHRENNIYIKNKIKLNYIYTLTDPRDFKVKYIGKTNNIKKRLYRHITESNGNSKKDNWIKKLNEINLSPIIEVLDTCEDDYINKLEIYWISQFISWGFELKNTTNGGDGGWDNVRHTNESIEKMRNNNPNMKSVIMFDREMNPLKKFKSLREASRETGLERPFILRSCTKNTTANNCYFKHSDLEFNEVIDWNTYLIKREYNNFNDIKSNDEWSEIISNSKSYKDIINKIDPNGEINAPKNKIFRLIKKLNIDISHFDKKRKK